MRARKPDRILGPYANRPGRWVIFVVEGATGKKNPHFVSDEKEASELAKLLRDKLEAQNRVTMTEAIEEYEKHLVAKGNKPKSYKETIRRLRLFFKDWDAPVAMLDSAKAREFYQTLALYLSVDSHLNYLAEAKTFLTWCSDKHFTPRNPLAGVKGQGKRKHGKPQLRIDEARRWIKKATQLADAGDQGAVAALLTLLLGLRASEITSRLVRDVDDNGKILWIDDSGEFTPKTEQGRRRVEIPPSLRPYMVRLTKYPGLPGQRGGICRLFEDLHGRPHWRDWPRAQVRRICELAKVPKVSAHAMRGLHATLAVDAGASSQVVASALGHESFTTTRQSYASAGSVDRAARRKALKVLR